MYCWYTSILLHYMEAMTRLTASGTSPDHPGSNSVNVIRLFPASSRRRRSHGHRHYSPSNLHNFSIDSFVTLIEKPLGIHHIHTKLYSLPLQRIKSLFDESKSILLPDSNSPKYRITGIILDVAHHRLHKPVLTNSYTLEKRQFLNIHFANKGT